MTVAVEVEKVTKRFRLYKHKPDSVKERVVKAGRTGYEEFWALRDVSFEVLDGQTVGLLGHNGSGKSTLLKCITGTLRPTTGHIRTRGRVAALLELGAGFHSELTGRENVYLNGSILGITRQGIDRIFDDIVAFAEIEQFIDQQVKHYSSGMYARLAFAVAVNVDPDVLLVDEVLAVGDESFQRKCMDRIRGFQRDGRTIILVTHAADLVRHLCDHAAVLDRGTMVTFGEPNDAVRVFRQTLAARGLDIPVEATESREERLTRTVRFTGVQLECPDGRQHLMTGDPLRIRIGYEASEAVPDCIFALEIHDQDGIRLLGTNTEHLGLPLGVEPGTGEVLFEFLDVPLLDGMYAISLGIHDTNGVEFDHRDQLDRVAVESRGRMSGRVAFPLRVSRRTAAGDAAVQVAS